MGEDNLFVAKDIDHIGHGFRHLRLVAIFDFPGDGCRFSLVAILTPETIRVIYMMPKDVEEYAVQTGAFFELVSQDGHQVFPP